MPRKKIAIPRRSFFRKSAAATALIGMSGFVTGNDVEAVTGRVNTNSQPSQLKIIDMRVVNGHGRWSIRL
ncbi:MAG: hypothetical protein HOC71_06380, partial [Candidatus Latescibacteria bacterium]|nr:hypothetical protein [Candidatus Latescibacterota bacterium]